MASAQCRVLVDVSECGKSGGGDQSGTQWPEVDFTKGLFAGRLSVLAALERLVCISIDKEESHQIVT